MIEIRQIKLPVGHTKQELREAITKKLKGYDAYSYQIIKKSIDSRKKPLLFYVYSVTVDVSSPEREHMLLRKLARDKDIDRYRPVVYRQPIYGSAWLDRPPVIVGAGPAGLFCGLMLARAGYCPRIIERGKDVDSRAADVEAFWRTGILKPDSNVQFGEGGAGTFSDGKLNTLVKDKYGRNREVLQIFHAHGAPDDILYDSRPHIGTDRLRTVIKGIREEICSLGGSISFETTLKDIAYTEEKAAGETVKHLTSITVGYADGRTETEPVSVLVLALGHSARDTFAMLNNRHVPMEAKAFAIGLRIEHDRMAIQRAQYGDSREAETLPSAVYKLTHQAADGRGVFTFCMCPGGYVVNASSESGYVAVNGMSNHDRMAVNSNSAVIVTVSPADFEGDGVLAGVEFQRKWERAAYQLGDGKIPVQRLEDLKTGRVTENFGSVAPNAKGATCMADLRECLPDYVIRDIIEGIQDFDRKLKGFADGDAVLSGIESRTSSPVRILRGRQFESEIAGLYPCGEGAGYAGGIMSAAMDGIKVFEAIAERYAPLH